MPGMPGSHQEKETRWLYATRPLQHQPQRTLTLNGPTEMIAAGISFPLLGENFGAEQDGFGLVKRTGERTGETDGGLVSHSPLQEPQTPKTPKTSTTVRASNCQTNPNHQLRGCLTTRVLDNGCNLQSAQIRRRHETHGFPAATHGSRPI